ncbi:hypothetical protein CHU94_00105 [Rhodoferax sp. TH121]|nr:hypothetical protein CHU94_00105 [Rhodoferax sp. TH121]
MYLKQPSVFQQLLQCVGPTFDRPGCGAVIAANSSGIGRTNAQQGFLTFALGLLGYHLDHTLRAEGHQHQGSQYRYVGKSML